MRRADWIEVVAVVLALGLADCRSATSTGGTPVATAQVEMPPSYRFDPPAITVKVGRTVTWHNSDHFTHSVRLLDGSGIEKVAAPGESVSITFDKPGEYEYDCGFHPRDMRGKVIVSE